MASIFDCPGSWDCNTSPIKVSDSLFLVALLSAAKGQQLTSSESVVKGQGEQVTLSCRVTGFALTNLYWICQKSGHGLELIEWS
ncbi:unnamed protein product [Arctogadus glacialis]